MEKGLTELADVLGAISETPLDYSLHVKNVALAKSLEGMEAELVSALETFTQFYAAGEDVWTALIENKTKTVDLDSESGWKELLALYEQAEGDYLSISIMKKHAQLLVDTFNKYEEGEEMKPAQLGEMFSERWMRIALNALAKKSIGHITQAHEVWDIYRDWELEQLERTTGDAKMLLAENITVELIERLRQPHSNSEDTMQAYSSFTTNHKPPQEYEQLLVDASKIRAQAVKSYSRREPMEASLTQSAYSLDAYSRYITWEARSKFPDLFCTSGLHERAIAEAEKRRWKQEVGAEAYLTIFWTSYADAVRTLTRGTDMELQVLKRAVRSVPASGEVWARYIRLLERASTVGSSDAAATVAELYDRAMGSGVAKGDVEQIVPVVLARAGFEKRRLEAIEDDDVLTTLIVVLESGLELIRKLPVTDSWFRIEKYVAEVYRSTGLVDNVVTVWEETVKAKKPSYVAYISYTDALAKANRQDDAREVFQNVHRKNFDWPEAVWDAWLGFEHLYGTVEEINTAIDQIAKARSALDARRLKEAEKAYQYAAEQAAGASMGDAPLPSDDAMVVDQPAPQASAASSERGTKRRADASPEADNNSKRQKGNATAPAEVPSLKRDRENSTVFVSELPADTIDDDLRAVFKDCGTIREIKITPLPNGPVATVEFMEKENVPAALTKDKKRIREQEIAVHLAWQSTLYVTNFPESADDATIRALFEKYGTLFDVRWPSKKFKNTRRFCYVQFTSPPSAQSALQLHGTELEPGLKLSVLISNPERKKGRTDQDANEREIHVGGLHRSTTASDLRKLFKDCGAIKDVRIGTANDGSCKGFAFVEFEAPEGAQAAVDTLHNSQFKSRRLSVVLSEPRTKRSRIVTDSGFGEQDDLKNRSVRIKNLPPDSETQEGLLQQVLEKFADIKRVEITGNQASVELASAVEAGKLLLMTEPVVFGGNTLQFVEDTAPVKSAASKFVPRAAGKPRAGGLKKRVAVSSGTGSSAGGPSHGTAPSTGKAQNDFRSMLK
ncbi:RNA-binding protein Prp24 [Cylindrobasidium torrendii FP15055 ss-10]|uniref:U4/U6 snRNA-associated-splicing factor PRP24 n=1 Tax=Cylindrobasidium torrendii FP15055 ss-10 TaxID=1314674 RepID=A0A0D7BMN6_9AGAR|nr:RNA-binding protein Prp24 [Cylindrobasidium torrendii FP15055 ss-10]